MNIRDILIPQDVADKIHAKHAVSEQEVYEIFENEEEEIWIRRSQKAGGRYVAYAGRWAAVICSCHLNWTKKTQRTLSAHKKWMRRNASYIEGIYDVQIARIQHDPGMGRVLGNA